MVEIGEDRRTKKKVEMVTNIGDLEKCRRALVSFGTR